MRSEKASIKQATAVPAPLARRIIERCRAQFSEADLNLLSMVLTEPVEYVDHEVFQKQNIETILFGGVAVRAPESTRFEETFVDGFDFSGITEETSLTTAQEILLFQRYNYARMRLVQMIDQLTPDTPFDYICEMLAWAHRAMDARSQLARANLPLVLAMAKRTRLNGLDFNELISEGNFALLRSVDKFDCSRGFKFSTYSCRAILKSFSRVAMRTSRYRGQFPTEFDPTLEKSDFIDRKRTDIEGQCVAEIREILRDNRADLNEVEQTVIRERFALDATTLPAKPKTLEQVGEMIGVTKERVRQIQNKALQKIRTTLEETLAA
ncbi:MAG TPA: sigma-70 family RNA polymerase sigma factor [Phycisphaerae bacterium]|nr:sigma-70 family RNA polymerase sigma factor [Phycisphaerae bacterium]HOJ73751.1 sigma-70 family RNA polymerase sigma factor [Phycisphaerae bacterium]HOM50398.1 sigma-70 family RNA polymerase sigma factor [Phycisphaerae bacterium]HON65684.1 sigma-70 family RNA polymerase sigma factor [Phycisphaerae bacterium]HOQ84190.1 sigma-70 family RNA polymerase sigma factor [Phycisphaerae bacterium]